jgi:MoaA/NifB/PqqE/SkfB family radical SAM enzyme
MDCAHFQPIGNGDFLRGFNQRVADQRVPLSGSFAISHRCNVGCVHCYVGDKARHYAGRYELETPRILSLIDEIADAGCLYLLLTGGEPMLHPDFKEIYTHAKRRGLIMTVFTNGTMVSDDILELFRDLPPHNVDISIYGATQETYESITRVPGSFDACMSGVQRLVDNGTHISLKTVLMTLNVDEYEAIEAMADRYDVRFRMDGALFPRFDGDPSPLKYRVDPRIVVEKEMANRQRAESWQSYMSDRKEMAPTDKLYTCGSGLSTFHIDPCGKLQGCLMSINHTYDLNKGSFAEGWHGKVGELRDQRGEVTVTTGGCGSGCGSGGCSSQTDEDGLDPDSWDNRLISGHCAAFARLETGREDQTSDYLNSLGKERMKVINGLEQTST